MDSELKEFLTAMEARLEGKIDASVKATEDRLVMLLTNVKDSLERGIHTRFDGVGAQLDAIDARLDRQGGWLKSGQTNLVRLNDWSESVDKLLADLTKRLAKLEQGGTH